MSRGGGRQRRSREHVPLCSELEHVNVRLKSEISALSEVK